MKAKLVFCLVILKAVNSFLPDQENQQHILTSQVSDSFLKSNQQYIEKMFGKQHLSSNKKSTLITQTKPWIWGQNDRVILMLEVKHSKWNCTISRNVVFLLNTGSPHTVISPTVKKLIFDDCLLPSTTPEKINVKINGRLLPVKVSKYYYHDTNVLGMDYMKQNSVQFLMKINRFQRDKSILKFKFDTEWSNQEEL